jgi:hypothetical protein
MTYINIALESDRFDMTIQDIAQAVRCVADQIELSGAQEGKVSSVNGWGRQATVGTFERKNG